MACSPSIFGNASLGSPVSVVVVVRSLTCVLIMGASVITSAAENNVPSEISSPNLLANPFMVSPKIELPPPPPVRASSVELPPLPSLNSAPALPQGLRVLLIRQDGRGLLGGNQSGSATIPVAHGKQVLIAGQPYQAEISRTGIRLYAARGALVWEGSLVGTGLISAPVEMARVQFTPPLSAGVSPGLKTAGASSAPNSQSGQRVTGVQ